MNIDTDILRDVVREATKEGIREAGADPATWEAWSEGLEMHAKRKAGGILLGGISSIFTRLAWILIAGMAIYMIGGWSALVAFFKSGGHAP